MNARVTELFTRLQSLEEEMEAEIAKVRAERGFSTKGRRVKFTSQAKTAHRSVRKGLIAFFRDAGPLNLLTAPVIYSLIVPMVLTDAWVTLYQHICFRAYAIPRVVRADYISLDRGHLRYLNKIEVLNCLFCSYSNGVIAYAREIASRTEQYWCPIKHALRISGAHKRYYDFAEYGDAKAYRTRLADFRKRLQEL